MLIDRLALEFEPGLGALTGETGAGKSILLDSLGLALGNRADASLVRSGQPGANVSAEIELPAGHAALAVLDEQGIDHEPGEPLILRRSLKADGGSRAFAGAASVPASLLRDVSAQKRTTDRLKDSERRFRTLFEEAPIAYHEINRNGIVTRVNQAECDLLGLSADEILNRHIWDFVAEDQRDTSRAAISRI